MAYEYVSSPDFTAPLRAVVAEVMDVADVTLGRNQEYAVRFRGQLRIDSVEAYERVADVFRAHDYTPLFRIEDGQHVIKALPGIINPRPSNPWINLILFVLTVFSAFYTGSLYSYHGPETDLGRVLFQALLQIYTGWPFALGMLSILLAHEFGHYIVARLNGAPVTLPYFIPMPYPISPFGTLGAVIAMKAPVRNRRILLDIGIAGPLAGFVVAVPVLIIGLMRSHIDLIPSSFPPGQGLSLEGNSIIYLLTKALVFGRLLPTPYSYGAGGPLLYWLRYFFTSTPPPLGGEDVLLDQVAWAGWAGLLVTGLNLIPAGQLDGGHTLYVLLGKRVEKILPVILVVLAGLGFFWPGWWLWAALIYFLNRRHAELLDEITQLDTRRKLLAIATLILFFLVITPVPLTVMGG
ncbi:MAG: site-2 protease family protein [Chloroflexi bacterium]|nr:site-2 protease family protein [Chloroflexota bacterium]